ncbi:MAG: hypothetical protein OXB97_04580 [Rhodospirillales bacterium]|nr:hypothetical protein [Rhodospirillales bacterium]
MFPNAISSICQLIKVLADHSGLAPATVGKSVSGAGNFYSRLRSGSGLTISRAETVMRRLSGLWPDDLPWPHDIPRPSPAPDSPAALAAAERQAAADEARRIAHRLDDGGRIADIPAFADFHGVRPGDVRQVILHWADGHGRGDFAAPERGSSRRVAYDGLIAAGDARFARQAAALGAVMGRVGNALGGTA